MGEADGWAGRGVKHKANNRGAWSRAVRSGVRWPPPNGEITRFDAEGWALTNAEASYNGSACAAADASRRTQHTVPVHLRAPPSRAPPHLLSLLDHGPHAADVARAWRSLALVARLGGRPLMCRWVALAKRSKKPGLTSVTRGDAFFIEVDTSLSEQAPRAAVSGAPRATAASATHEAPRGGADKSAVPVLQLTYLQSYESVGVVRVACHRGCTCRSLTVDTLVTARRFATLSTALSAPVTRAAACVLRVSNESPEPEPGSAPRSKVKLVSLAVLSQAGRGK